MPKIVLKGTVIKPCPFCGGGDLHLPSPIPEEADAKFGPILAWDCNKRDASGPVVSGSRDKPSVTRAVRAWNTRGGPVGKLASEARRMSPPETEGKPSLKDALPCPFCNCRDVIMEEWEDEETKGRDKTFYVVCLNCETCGPAHDTTAAFALIGWNKRANIEPPKKKAKRKK